VSANNLILPYTLEVGQRLSITGGLYHRVVRGETGIAAPAAGKLNVRAVPDNCEVLVNGTFVDYPPILDHPVAAGRHTVSFRWPDGVKSEQVVEVKGGRPTFVVGRKE
jgi:hypothetical protein